MTPPDITPKTARNQRVTFPDLVRVHYRWRKVVGADSTASAQEREAADAAYHLALERFEDEQGEPVSADVARGYTPFLGALRPLIGATITPAAVAGAPPNAGVVDDG